MTSDSPSPGGSKGWLTRSVWVIALASLFSDLGHEMATASLPALLASLGAGSAALGLIEGLSDAMASFGKLASGVYSDRLTRRKPLAVAGYALTALGIASLAMATRWWHVLAGRSLAWTGRGARTPVRNVLLTEATTPQTYGRAFGFERAMDSLGAVIGPAIALPVVAALGLRRLLALTLVPGVLAAILIAAVKEQPPKEKKERVHLWQGVRGLSAAYKRFLLGVGVFGLGDFSNTLLILWATQAWTPRMGFGAAARGAMALYVAYNLVYALSAYLSGGMADRFPKRRVLAVGYALAAVPALGLLLPSTSILKFVLIFVVSGLYMGVWETLESSTAAAALSPRSRGLGFGVLATVNGVGDLVSSVVVGLLWTVSPILAMGYVITTSIGGAVLIFNSPADTAD